MKQIKQTTLFTVLFLVAFLFNSQLVLAQPSSGHKLSTLAGELCDLIDNELPKTNINNAYKRQVKFVEHHAPTVPPKSRKKMKDLLLTVIDNLLSDESVPEPMKDKLAELARRIKPLRI